MEEKMDLGKVAMALLAFAMLYLATAFVLSFSDKVVGGKYRLDGSVGPITVSEPGTVYNVSVNGALPDNSWSYVEVVLQNEKKEYLFSFGKEMWRESGYDSEGPWHESDMSFSQKITIPEKGVFFLGLTGENSTGGRGNLSVQVDKVAGSSLPHMWIGILLLVAGLILNEIKNRSLITIASAFTSER